MRWRRFICQAPFGRPYVDPSLPPDYQEKVRRDNRRLFDCWNSLSEDELIDMAHRTETVETKRKFAQMRLLEAQDELGAMIDVTRAKK